MILACPHTYLVEASELMKEAEEMKKNRYLLCFLLGGVLLYYAVPRIDIFAQGESGIFALAWLGLALCVLAGNLTAMLYAPKRTAAAKRFRRPVSKPKARAYQR